MTSDVFYTVEQAAIVTGTDAGQIMWAIQYQGLPVWADTSRRVLIRGDELAAWLGWFVEQCQFVRQREAAGAVRVGWAQEQHDLLQRRREDDARWLANLRVQRAEEREAAEQRICAAIGLGELPSQSDADGFDAVLRACHRGKVTQRDIARAYQAPQYRIRGLLLRAQEERDIDEENERAAWLAKANEREAKRDAYDMAQREAEIDRSLRRARELAKNRLRRHRQNQRTWAAKGALARNARECALCDIRSSEDIRGWEVARSLLINPSHNPAATITREHVADLPSFVEGLY